MKLPAKILLWISVPIPVIATLIAAGSYLLYATADMKQPDPHLAHNHTQLPLHRSDSLRTYGNNTLSLNKHGIWEMYVEGEPFDRGIAIGKMAQDLLYYQEKVFVNEIKRIIPSERYLKLLRYLLVIFNRKLGHYIPEENREEIYGISLACTHEFDAIGTPYERQLNYHAAHDIGHMMQAYMLVGCTSFATWGTQSTDSSLIIGRNFDFYVGDDFARNKLVACYTPAQGYQFASIGWIGMTGVLSGINETGLTVTINAAQASIPVGAATPVSILARIILQYASNINEAYDIARKHKTFVAESLLIGSANDRKAAIIEKSPHKTALYTSNNERIVCTNHYQSDTFAQNPKNLENIRTTDTHYRFKRMHELLNITGKINPVNAAKILRDTLGIGNKPIGLTNEKAINQFIAHHSVIFQPEKLKMWVSSAPWQMGEYVEYDLRQIFSKAKNNKQKPQNLHADQIIPADSAILNGTIDRVNQYRKIKTKITDAILKKNTIDTQTIKNFVSTNPNYYYTYELLADYLQSQHKTNEALIYWKKALNYEIPRWDDKEQIRLKIEKNQTKNTKNNKTYNK